MEATISPNDIHLADFQGFSCTLCGWCCNRPWRVVVETEVQEIVLNTQAVAQKEREGYVPVHVCQDTGDVSLGRRPDTSCVFFDDVTAGCDLHLEIGLKEKPLGCQMYPYRGVQTPSGTFFYQSWTCPPVVAGQDRNVAENAEHLAYLTEKFEGAVAKLPDEEYPVRLTTDVFISWKSYLRLENWLMENFDPENPINSVLSLAASLASMSAQSSQAELQDDNLLPKPPSSLSIEQATLIETIFCYVLTLIEADEQELFEGVYADLEAGVRLASRRVDITLPPFAIATDFSPLIKDAFARYLRNALVGKILLDPSIVSRLLAIGATYSLVLLYAEGLREKRQGEQISLEDLTVAFSIVEEPLSHHRYLEGIILHLQDSLVKLS